MKQLLFFLLLFSSLQAAAQFSFADFKKLYTLSNAQGWEMKIKKGLMIEQWDKVNDSLLAGRNYLLVAGSADTTIQEEMQLRFSNGVITYSPLVKDQNEGRPVNFTLKAIDAFSFTFENKEHDFPQRIVYSLGEQSFRVTISAITNEEAPVKTFHFVMRRH